MRNLDRQTSIFLILLSIAICLASSQLQIGRFWFSGPMIFPLLLGLVLLALSVALFVQSASPPQKSFLSPFQKGEGLKVISFMGIFSLCVFLFEPMGFVVSIFALNLLLLKVLGGTTLWKSILCGLVTSLTTYLLFARVLGTPLPKGVLSFL